MNGYYRSSINIRGGTRVRPINPPTPGPARLTLTLRSPADVSSPEDFSRNLVSLIRRLKRAKKMHCRGKLLRPEGFKVNYWQNAL